jgi:hypothetical protein
MLQTKFGSPDGIQVYQYQAGQVYTVPDELANIFLSQGWAVEDKTLDGKIETKEIKAETGAVNIQTNVRPRKKK